ncbi:phosphate/phosphite/phosphonate ABC transporter substrate-binding protein [Sciscionella sediminilitoris]|uniref:phosphate/phosphite/phosphonate ABC transporter substrate-binding protein n=1 Tax=Sciscionella sediminilitoris TaxID=1445613 RepID=UPI0004DF33E2|nr:phosphate/phosphite/phosphonate ABC transporter substrate-binding protein [Sciscionella sp. SE31]
MGKLARQAFASFACLAAVFGLAACGSSAAQDSGSGRDPGELVFASIPSENATSLQQEMHPLVAMLERETGKKIKVQNATNYAAVIEGQRAGKIDIAAYGPLSYVVAKANGVRITPIGAQVQRKGDPPQYRSYGLVKAGSPIKDLAGFNGKKVCFVDPNSTSGYLYPKAGLTEAGVDPDKGISPVMSGGHDASALAVANGQCDAGFAYDSMVDKLLPQRGQLPKNALRVVWKSAMIPGSPIAISDNLPGQTKHQLTQAFAGKANADYLRTKGFCSGNCDIQGYWGYAPVTDKDFDSVRKVCAITKDVQCRQAS